MTDNSKPPEADIAFDKLDESGKLVKIRHHIAWSKKMGYPVPAPWVGWLLEAYVEPQSKDISQQEKIADYWADWLIDAVGGATQNRALLRGDPAEDEVLTQAIVQNSKKAILNALKASAVTE
jgi:hypothetical protein